MTVKLLYHIISPPSRASMFTLKALGIPHELQIVNLFKYEHHTPEYLQINPQHTVPVLKDNDFVVWDSHAINAYLVDKYGKDDSLYPKNLEKRAIVNQRLHFDSGVLFASLRNITVPILAEGNLEPISQAKINNVEQGYSLTEKILESGMKYIADNHVTIADFSVVTTLNALKLLVPTLSEEYYPRTVDYLKRCEEVFPSYIEINTVGTETAKKVFDKIGFKNTVPGVTSKQ